MSDAAPPAEPPQSSGGGGGCGDFCELNRALERIIEEIENISVQLTLMVHDMAALRTSPDIWTSMQELEAAHLRCRAAVRGDGDPAADSDKCPGAGGQTTQTDVTQM